ncbi:uncharacterized protein LOC135084480 isoform X2 [Ostrinia nubilalis]
MEGATDSSSETKEPPNSGKEGDGENLDAIKKFIEDQEKEYTQQETKKEDNATMEVEKPSESDGCKDFDERLAVASSMMDMILSESEERIAKKKDGNSSRQMSPKGANSMSLSVGSKVEAKDFGEFWYPAQISEVDYDEMEVLVHYEDSSKKHDEWISVSSPRLRPLSASAVSSPAPSTSQPATTIAPVASTSTAEEPKPVEDKSKLTFVVGERCLARWRDSRRFLATVSKDLGDGYMEVVFDDGFVWKCTTSRLHKMKDQSKPGPLSVDVTTAGTSAHSPVYGAGPSSATPTTPAPAFHTHLFDPTRDYLGSKSERREMKRKLNIKEIFNIGQKKAKKQATPTEKPVTPKPPVERKKPRIIRKKPAAPKVAPPKVVPKTEIPDAVASIIGTLEGSPAPSPAEVKPKEEKETKEEIKETKVQITKEVTEDQEMKVEVGSEETTSDEPEVKDTLAEMLIDVDESKDSIEVVDPTKDTCDTSDTADSRPDSDPAQEDVKLEKFEAVDGKHEEVIDRIKVAITKLEDGISKAEGSPRPEVKTEAAEVKEVKEKKIKKLKIKKSKKLRILQEKKVKKQVEKVKSELEVMKRQIEVMRRQMVNSDTTQELPESFLLPGEWCCKWVNGQPIGKVCELEMDGKEKAGGLPRRSVQVEDKRLPAGWTKHMVRRSLGSSAGKWDVVLVNPENRRFHTRTDMRNYMESHPDTATRLKDYEAVLMDFGVHLKLARRMGWVVSTPDGVAESPVVSLPAGTLSCTSPIIKRKKLSLKRPREAPKQKKMKRVIKMPKYLVKNQKKGLGPGTSSTPSTSENDPTAPPEDNYPPLEDGYVWVGSLKVQIIENLLRCPAEGCFKNFRNNTLLQMHIKHYHRELRKMLGRTPKVLDLAYARTMPEKTLEPTKTREPDLKTIKVKVPKPPKRVVQEEIKPEVKKEEAMDLQIDIPSTSVKLEDTPMPKLHDSPKLRQALVHKPVKRPKVLLPVRRPESEDVKDEQSNDFDDSADLPIEVLDFETEISTHTVTKPVDFKKKEKRGKVATLKPKSEDDEWFGPASDVETRSSFPRSGTPDYKRMEQHAGNSESNEEQQRENEYEYNPETGELMKIEHMKREEIINCHCGFREEDGLMVQCELCLCWQHGLCHNLRHRLEVPEKYTCSICLNPRRGRRSKRFLHDQDRLFDGTLPGAKPSDTLRRSHELSGNLHLIRDALHSLRVKYHVATKKNHPKLYLWADKEWDTEEVTQPQDKPKLDYTDLQLINIDKENQPVQDDLNAHIDVTTPSEDHDRYSQRDGQALLGGLLAAPLELPISAAELERLASAVPDHGTVHRALLLRAGPSTSDTASERPGAAGRAAGGAAGAAHQRRRARAPRQRRAGPRYCTQGAAAASRTVHIRYSQREARRCWAGCWRRRWSCPSAPPSSSASPAPCRTTVLYTGRCCCEQDRPHQIQPARGQALLGGLLAAPLELPISAAELERLASAVPDHGTVHRALLLRAGPSTSDTASERPGAAGRAAGGAAGAAHQRRRARAPRQRRAGPRYCTQGAAAASRTVHIRYSQREARRCWAGCWRRRWSCPSAPPSSSASPAPCRTTVLYTGRCCCEQDRPHQIQPARGQALLGGLLAAPLELPISAAELERLASAVPDHVVQPPIVPQPEAAIDNGVCRERLLRHIQRCQAALDSRLDTIEATVAGECLHREHRP